MGRLAERPPELAAEVGAREAGGAGHVVDVERLGVARVGEVLGAQQMPCRRGKGHASVLRALWRSAGPIDPAGFRGDPRARDFIHTDGAKLRRPGLDR